MHPIAMYKASTSRHNATVQLVCAGALTSMASNLRILAQGANQVAVNRKRKKKKSPSRTHSNKIFSFCSVQLDEVIINAAALTSDDEDDESGDDDDDDSTEGSADNMLAF